MKNVDEYYNRTINNKPNKLLMKFFDMKLDRDINEKTAIDLGCGTGNDTIFLLDKGFKVTAVDKENKVINIIKDKIQNNKNLSFIIDDFAKIRLHKVNLITANFSLHFCNPLYFDKFMCEITENISLGGYFVGNFLGKEDQWFSDKTKTFVDRNKIQEIFKGFDIIHFNEEKYYKDSVSIKNKYWHVFNVIVQKKEE